MTRFESNIKLLEGMDPHLAARVKSEPVPENFSISYSIENLPVPVLENNSLHSTYYPERDAAASIREFNPEPDSVIVVFGLGFGYHVRALLDRFPNNIVVIEPRMSLFRAFLEHVDLKVFANRVQFRVDEPAPKILARSDTGNWDVFIHAPSTFVSPDYFEKMNRCIRVMDVLESHSLRILVVNPVYGGSLPTARFCKETLISMGHEVDSVDCDRFKDAYFEIQKITEIKNNQRSLNHKFMQLMGDAVVAKAVDFKPDLVLALAQAPMSPEAISKFREMKTPVAFWFVEDFNTLTYWKDVAGLYDYFFTIQQGEFFRKMKAQGLDNFYYLPQAAHPETQYPVALNEDEYKQFSADLSFMGEGYYNRHKAFTRLLDQNFKIWGTGWNQDPVFWPHLQNNGERVSSEDCVKIYNAGKVNLNLHSSTYHDGINPNGDFVNPRTFEIAACGGFQLVDERSELGDCFQIGEEMVTFSNLEEMRAKALYYLENPEERRKVAERGRQRVLREHTIRHRMHEMLLHIYSEREQELEIRTSSRESVLDRALDQVADDPELREFLEPFRGQKDFKFQSVIDRISEDEGSFKDPELLFLMVEQIIPKKS
ncbi:spore maturation protein CgeB [Nitrospina gracilis]|uniref:glycosyltransferase family protein n=1 Tax=Nitrospina sp. Nb-3 TaxID=2940485 RepID=UPI001F3A99D8|nr:glycosyltransferase [Nitrospina sp. Nb-3]MCF8724335.1 spore maturation protein CgeB [Nitrospina sp. Nb-3]